VTDLDVAAIAVIANDGIVVLIVVLAFSALKHGMVDGLKTVAPWRRNGPQPKAPPREPGPAAGPPGDVVPFGEVP
jgi:hypothetical protein